MKRLKIKFVTFENALAMQILVKEGLPEENQTRLDRPVYDFFDAMVLQRNGEKDFDIYSSH